MGRVASAGDNAAMESFFALLQKNVLEPAPLAHPRRAALRDRHLDRAHLQPPAPPTRLGKLTPVEFELAFTAQPDTEDAAKAA